LLVLGLGLGLDLALMVEDDAARAGGALVNRSYVLRHQQPPCQH
jgi:hypothetical protein